MSSRILPQARTTPKIRQGIKDSGLSDREAAKVFNITRATAAKWLKLASPIKIIKLLTDNGSQFTDRFTDRKPSGQHAFDKVRATMDIERRLAPPRHPQTNGMVERFNGRIGELLHCN